MKNIRHLGLCLQTGAFALAVLVALPVFPATGQVRKPGPKATTAASTDRQLPNKANAATNNFAGLRTLRGTRAGRTRQDEATTENAANIFSDGGIEQADRDDQAASVPVPTSRARQARLTESAEVNRGKVRPELAESPVPGSVNEQEQPDPRQNLAVDPVETGIARRPEIDPFLPTGFRAGSWNVFVRLQQALGYTTNTSRSAGGTGGAVSQTSTNLTLRSDWRRHEALIEANGSLERVLRGNEQSIPQAGVTGNLRLDLIDGFSASLRGNYSYRTEAVTSNALSSAASERPGIHGFGGSAELLRGGQKLELAIRASADRTLYEQAQLSGGGILVQDDRNNTLYQLTGRAGYELSPAIKPYLQAGIGRRLHDLETDRNGEKRDSTVLDLRSGIAVNLGEKLRGDLSIGYLREDFDGSGLATLAAPALNGSLDWSPHRGTNVAFTVATSFNGATSTGNSGTVARSFSVNVEQQIRDRLSVNARLGLQIDGDQSGERDTTITASVGLEYWINRFLAVTAELEHQRFDSATTSSSWDAATARLGLTLQR